MRRDDDVPELMAVSEKEGEMVCVTVEVPEGIADAVASALAEAGAVAALEPVALTVLVLTCVPESVGVREYEYVFLPDGV